MATIYPKPGNTAQLCSALPRIQAGVWVVSGPRRHQEAAGIHGEAAQDSAVGLLNFDIIKYLKRVWFCAFSLLIVSYTLGVSLSSIEDLS